MAKFLFKSFVASKAFQVLAPAPVPQPSLILYQIPTLLTSATGLCQSWGPSCPLLSFPHDIDILENPGQLLCRMSHMLDQVCT